MTPKFKYKIEHGHIVIENREGFVQECRKYEEAYLTVSKDRPNRSNEQNRYYWGVVNKMISQETGYTPQEVHQILLCEAFGMKEIGINDINYLIPNKTTSELNTGEMEEFLTKCREFASIGINLYIPLPNEVEY